METPSAAVAEVRGRTCCIRGISIATAPSRVIVDATIQLFANRGTRPIKVFAIHVSGLNMSRNANYADAMRNADIVYPDGYSVTTVMKAAGARGVRPSPTTDFGWDLLAGLQESLGRPLRIFTVGGQEGIAEVAGKRLCDRLGAIYVGSTHGYHSDWTSAIGEMCCASPDAIIVGLGVPIEVFWIKRHEMSLPPALLLTCGGWLKFLAGTERRAPTVVRRLRLEWLWRVAQDPRRLMARYAVGAFVTCHLATLGAIGRLMPLVRSVRINETV